MFVGDSLVVFSMEASLRLHCLKHRTFPIEKVATCVLPYFSNIGGESRQTPLVYICFSIAISPATLLTMTKGGALSATMMTKRKAEENLPDDRIYRWPKSNAPRYTIEISVFTNFYADTPSP